MKVGLNHEYNMILSKIKLSSVGKQIVTQIVVVQCDKCQKEWNSALINQIKGFKNYNRDLCRGCKQKEQVKNGVRKKQYVNAGEASIQNMKGKTYEELYGNEKAKQLKQQCSKNTSGEKNPMYGKNYQSYAIVKLGKSQKGKSLEEIYGNKKAKEIKNKISIKTSGKNNPMYGKPSPKGSGNGWSGWYKGWFFRSLRELSYMINVIERFNLSWESAEKSKYKIKYVDWQNTERTYHPDFLVEGKYLIEIKPKKLWGSDNNIRKKQAAIKFCTNKNLKYKLTESVKTLTFNELKILVDTKKIKFTERYKEKFKLWEREN
jgi:hypothetical protein